MPIRILIAGDHAVFRAGLKALLEKESALQIVGEAGDGFATVEAATNLEIDVLLLDITMPNLSGVKVAELVLRKRPKLAIVVLTMHEDEYYLREFLKIGVRGFVLKKSTRTELLTAIRATYDGEQFVDPILAGHVISTYVGGSHGKKTGSRQDLLTPREHIMRARAIDANIEFVSFDLTQPRHGCTEMAL